MNPSVNELDLLPAIENTSGPELRSACCNQCTSSLQLVTTCWE
jgi:hypothetical protein